MCFQEMYHKKLSNELFDCIFRDNFSINKMGEVLLSSVANMEMGTLLRTTVGERVLRIPFVEIAKKYFVLREFGNMTWESETV